TRRRRRPARRRHCQTLMSIRLFGVGAMLVALGGAGVTLARMATPASSQAEPRSRLPPATAEVMRATLVETKTMTGTLGFGDETPVRAIVDAGSGQLTWLAAEGAIVERGQPLFAIDGQPVVVFYGEAPFFRTLTFNGDSFDSFEWFELK